MRKDTVLQLKSMYSNAKKRENEWTSEFLEGSYQREYAHGMVVAYREIFENLAAFENVNMFDNK